MLQIACYPNLPKITTYCFSGTIDEVIIYNRSLSAGEIKQHYTSGLLSYTGWSSEFKTAAGTQMNVSDGIYLQFNATLATNNSLATPYLFNVTVNYANTSTNMTNDTIRANDTSYDSDIISNTTFTTPRYIASNNLTATLGIVSAGTDFMNIQMRAYSDPDYLLQLTQGSDDNRVLIAFANMSWSSIDSAMPAVSEFGMLAKTFAGFALQKPTGFSLFLRLVPDINLMNSTRWGSGPHNIRIRNVEKKGAGNITIEVIG